MVTFSLALLNWLVLPLDFGVALSELLGGGTWISMEKLASRYCILEPIGGVVSFISLWLLLNYVDKLF